MGLRQGLILCPSLASNSESLVPDTWNFCVCCHTWLSHIICKEYSVWWKQAGFQWLRRRLSWKPFKLEELSTYEKVSHDAMYQPSKQLGVQKQIDPWGFSIGHKATLLHLAETQRQVKTRNLHVGKKRPRWLRGSCVLREDRRCTCALWDEVGSVCSVLQLIPSCGWVSCSCPAALDWLQLRL